MPPQRPVIVNPGQKTMSEQLFGNASPSVFDSGPKKLAKKVASLLGMDDPPDPASAAMDFANPMGAVIGRASRLAPQVIRTLSGETVPRGIRAYHASPHRFDRFDMNRIGSGEGAQVRGHGLYFAEHPATAEYYRRTLAGGELNIPGGGRIAVAPPEAFWRGQRSGVEFETLQDHALSFIEDAHGRGYKDPFEAAKRTARLKPASADPRGVALQRNRDDIIGQIEEWQSQGATLDRGGMTAEVNLGVRPEELLNLDRPVGAQTPEVQAALRRAFDSSRAVPRPMMLDAFTGGLSPMRAIPDTTRAMDLVRPAHTTGPLGNDPRIISEVLREAGIPGSTYLDEASRPAGEGTRNIVMFGDEKIDIVKQLMLLLGIGAPAAAGTMQQKQEPRRPSMGSIR